MFKYESPEVFLVVFSLSFPTVKFCKINEMQNGRHKRRSNHFFFIFCTKRIHKIVVEFDRSAGASGPFYQTADQREPGNRNKLPSRGI